MERQIKSYFKNKKVLVFGGTGSWGSELIRQFISYYNPSELRVFSRGEHKQVEMRHKYSSIKYIKYIIGDVRDLHSVDVAMHGVDVVINLSALKHVPVCEENVWEAIQTNVHGVHNIITASLKHNIDLVVQVSTDKAVDPINLYGFTKGCAEKLITSANSSPTKSQKTKFVCVRGGNVLSTTGSVVPLFKYQIKKHNKITITDKDMSRFIMRVEQAIQLVLKASIEAVGGEIFVMKMPGINITDLGEVMIENLGNAQTKQEYVGVRPGEKKYEVLVSKNESHRTVEEGDYYIILPYESYTNYKKKKYKKNSYMEMDEYNSKNTLQLNKKKILKLLEQDGWLNNEKEEQYSSLFSPYKE